jgi:replication initiation and membrane attachment protein
MNLKAQDKFIVENTLEWVDFKPLFKVYQRVLGPSALNLYGYLFYDNSPKNEKTHQDLCEDLNITLAKLDHDFERLEQLNLIDIYIKYASENHYVYKINAPLTILEFLKNDVFGRLFLKLVGPSQYEFLLEEASSQCLSIEGYEPIKHALDKTFMQTWSAREENSFSGITETVKTRSDLNFDIRNFLSECSLLLFPKRYRTEQAIESIKEIGSVYGISVSRMIELVGKCYTENETTLNIKKLRKMASNEMVQDYPSVESVYDYPPVLFLKKLRKDIEPTALEKYLLNQLIGTMGLNPQVVNVLIESSYKANNQTINTRNVEMIGMQWATLNIKTVDQAKKQASSNFKSGSSNTKRRVEKVSDYTTVEQKALSFEEENAIKEAFMKLGEE